MGRNIANKLMGRKNKDSEKDEVLESLEEHSNNFLNRIRSYGYNSIEEWERDNLYPTPVLDKVKRYPVNSDV